MANIAAEAARPYALAAIACDEGSPALGRTIGLAGRVEKGTGGLRGDQGNDARALGTIVVDHSNDRNPRQRGPAGIDG